MEPTKSFPLSSLPSGAAQLCLRIEKFITELRVETKGKDFVLAYSGGADSKALFFILLALSPRMGFSLHLAHLDHSFRETSAQEAKEASELAGKYSIPCFIRRINVAALADKMKIGSEEAGRVARLEYFNEIRNELDQKSKVVHENNKADKAWIIQGHQLNDLAEDSLMRLMRGSGWPALAGMQAVDWSKHILRPMLLTPRAELENFLQALGQNWVKDPMNQDPAYLRNRVRSSLLPTFIQENPAFLQSVEERWRMAMLDRDFFDELLKIELKELVKLADGALQYPLSHLRKLDSALRMRLYFTLLEKLGPGQALASSLRKLDAALMAKRSGSRFQFPGKKLVILNKNYLVFSII